MKARDWITMAGAFFGAMGPPMMALGEGRVAWWLGLIFTSIGSGSIAARALLHEKPKPEKEDQ